MGFTPDAPPAPAEELLYVQGRTLKAYDLAGGSTHAITELPSADVAVSPDGRLFVAIREAEDLDEESSSEGHEGEAVEGEGAEGQSEDPEGFADPEVVIASTGGPEEPSLLGPGRSPVWGPNSASVAVVVPSRRGEAIHLYQLPGTSRETAAPKDELWSIVGWQGTDVVAIGSRSGPVAISSLTDEVMALGMPAFELWGASPASPTYLTVTDEGTYVENGSRARLGGLGGGRLADGSWSWDGSRIAAAAVSDDGDTSLVLINTRTTSVKQVPGSAGAQGNVVWSPGSDHFAYVRVDRDQPSRLIAAVCTIELECRDLFPWTRGVRLLAFR